MPLRFARKRLPFRIPDLRHFFAFFYGLIDCPESRVIRLVK
jgi:hypothetical protein